MEKIGGQTRAWIDANIMNRSSVVTDGRPVYPAFRRDAHVAKKPLEPIAGVKVQVGLDFGRNPAALIGQCLRGDWYIQREFIGRNVSAVEFAPALRTYLKEHYPGFVFQFWGDPSGAVRGQATDTTPFDVFRAHGMPVMPIWDAQNRASLRREAVNAVLTRRSASGGPVALLVDPRCTTYITGMAGGYHLRRRRVSGEVYSEEAEKNQYSHICEAGEYLLVGGGEGRSVLVASSERKPVVPTRRPYNPFQRSAGIRGW
jgi:hypothetical protein